ncbi:hypothetical protein BFJ68_g2939 [Fusarium oxysporum]|uniref:Extracellular membrane protein CFEM domain-containing protein n=1 Tax=Fusarium oxysporum TaxID=5507 RepID=A0A420RTA7_FUSOX|nr:hypothetical protein BFJ67_g5756 [Fusarium oxysporum f. sp. cepae]RKL20230.1 hypothetical protein BFJ68_g2939 [Fusarium oxysporum]
MKFLPLAVALFATLTVAAPSSPSDIQARSCVCKKVGDDWICTGTKCYDKVKRDLVPRQCSCHKIGDEWLCGGPKCPRDLPEENKLAKRQLDESVLGTCRTLWVRSKPLSNPFIIAKREASGRSSVKSTYARLVSWQELVERVITDSAV